MKYLQSAKEAWSIETKQESTTIPKPTDLAPLLKGGLMPVCPAGGTYTLGMVNEPPRCSHADKGHSLTPTR